MAEYNKEKLYFFKLPANFFQGHKMRILESLPNGKEYELMYLKLICESVSHNGYLRFSESQPYTEEMIAAITNSTVQEAKACLLILEKFELVRITEGNSIFLVDVPKMTGSTTEGAQRKQDQRKALEDKEGTKGGQEGDICPPEIRD